MISPFEVARELGRNLLERLGEPLAGLGIPVQGLDLTKPPDDPTALAQTLDETLRRLEQTTGAWVLLPRDQAEAMLVGDRPAGDPAKLLLDALAQLLGRQTRHAIVAATIRTEFVPRLEAVFAGSEVRLRQAPLSAIGWLAEVIEKPAELFWLELERELSEQIVADCPHCRCPAAAGLHAEGTARSWRRRPAPHPRRVPNARRRGRGRNVFAACMVACADADALVTGVTRNSFRCARRGVAGYRGQARQRAFWVDGFLATATHGPSARLWDMASPNPCTGPRLLPHGNVVYQVVFSPDSRWAATAGSDQRGKLWDLGGSEPKAIAELKRDLGAADPCADLRSLANGSTLVQIVLRSGAQR